MKNNFFEENLLNEVVRSIRSSKYGYTNSKDVQVSYSSIQNYVSDLSSMVKRGLLSAEREFYSPVRLRGGHHVSELEDNGIRYIELRNIDLNPLKHTALAMNKHNFSSFLNLFTMER
ncbi:Glutathione biosynthesis bifunctional protein GshAB OS=Lysinibacillus sphaericus OX=1421 GN=gshAB PE=3 SV=1 [Lysinibacillus sphaericus]